MLLNNRSLSMGKDGHPTSVGDVVPNIGASLQALPRDPEMLMKVPFPRLIIGFTFTIHIYVFLVGSCHATLFYRER